MQHIKNPFRNSGMTSLADIIPTPSVDAGAVAKLLAHCPAHAKTPLIGSTILSETFRFIASASTTTSSIPTA